MAFSSSINKKAQIVKKCDLCETETNLKWRCIQCDNILCEKCKKIHNKVQTTTKHQIVDLRTPFQDVEQKVILDNIKCDEHQTKMTCLFCRTCDHLVCPDCISSKHNKHNFEPVEKILSEKLDELKGAEARYCKDLTLCRAKVEEFQISETKYESMFDESITQIKEREQTMIDSVRKYSIELQKQIELDQKSEKNKFLNIKRQTDQAEKTIIHHQDEIMAALKSIQGSTIFATATKSKKMMSDLNFNPIPSEIKYFIPGKETVNDIPSLFGSLQKMKISQVQSDIHFEVVNSYTTDLSGIHKIITVDDKSTWVNDYSNEVIRQINIDNDNITTTKQISCKIFDMTLTSNNDILLSVRNSSDINLLTKSGEIKPLFSVSSVLPMGIHVTSDNNIIVGVVERGATLTLTDKSTRALHIFGMDGRQQHTYQYDSNKHRLFTLPYRITTNNNKDIVVVDKTSCDTGSVVVVGWEGGLRWTYTGHYKINVTTQFDPNDVVTTTTGHIIVSDYSTHALHVLSEQGDILTCKVMEDTGIKYPFSLDIDMRGQLWVGCYSSKQSGAKIHKVNIL
jgi:hypothetical protein